MHLTRHHQISNQMCPPPLGPPTAWFMNPHPPQPPSLPSHQHQIQNHHQHHQQQQQHHHQQQQQQQQPSPTYHNYHSNHTQSQQQQQYHPYSSPLSSGDNNTGSSILQPATSLQQTHVSGVNSIPSGQNGSPHLSHQHQHHLHQSHQHLQQPLHSPQQYNSSNNYPYQQQQQQQQHQQQQTQFNQIQHQQPLAIQQPQQSQHVHPQQPSPLIQQQYQQPQLSPHAHNIQRPSPTIHPHAQQSSPNYQQHSPVSSHLTSPSLQPSPIPHHQQPSPIGRHRQQPTPPHHAPTPTSLHQCMRPASAKSDLVLTGGSNNNVTNSNCNNVTNGSSSNHNSSSSVLQTEVRVLELNRRLQCRPTVNYRNSPLPSFDQYDNFSWWEEFRNDFFRDDAILTLSLLVEDKPVRYVLRKKLISRFFKSYFEGGVTELSINLRNSREIRGHNMVTLECNHANIITKNILKHPKVSSASKVVVCTEGQLYLEFVGNSLETLMIKAWRFKVNQCREYIDRSITAIGLPNTLLVEPTTVQGFPNSTLSYLKSCSVMESMQELMAYQKLTNMEPKNCLKKLLFERYGFKAAENDVKPTRRRRKRKQPESPVVPNSASSKRAKASSGIDFNSNASNLSSPRATHTPVPPPDVMVVGEPSSMAAEYKDDNERSITKIENSNHVPTTTASSTTTTTSTATEIMIRKSDQYPIEMSEKEEIVSTEKKETIKAAQVEYDETKSSKPPADTNIVENDRISAQVDQPEDPAPQEIAGQFEITSIIENENHESDPSSSAESDKPSTDDVSKPQIKEENQVEKENNSSLALNDETSMNSTATQSDSHCNILNSISEDREDNCRSASCDSIVSKLPPASNHKGLSSNGASNKQNRRRSSERKETLREGLMRTSDFVVALKDLKCEHPSLWRITTGNNLLQQFEPKTQNGTVLYENTNQYAGWNPEIKRDYVGVDVKLTQHTRNQITVERLLLNFQKLEDSESFHDKHFVIYMQIILSTALDPKFWESIENEPEHHDYFLTSRRIIEDITKRFKIKLTNKLKLTEASIKNVEKYPNLLIKPVDEDQKDKPCRACNTNLSTQVVTFGNRTYDLHSYKPVKVTSELSKIDDKDLHNNLCETCLEIVKLYSEIHHMGWKLYNIAKEKVDVHRSKGKPINTILDECLKDEDWLSSIYAERDALWSKVEQVQ